MRIMSVQSRRKSRFESLGDDELDRKGNRNGLQYYFAVSYVGETVWQDKFSYVNEIMEAILPAKHGSVKFWIKKEPQRKVKLHVDACSTSVYIENTEGISERCFKFCNIKEVIYCGNMKQYSKYLILVVSSESEVVTKAHIFACGSVKEAKNAFKIITDLFTHARREKPDFSLHSASTIDGERHCDEKTNSLHSELATNDDETKKQNSLSEGEQLCPEVEDSFVETAFTAFARSRSFSSSHGQRYTSSPKRKMARPYSLPGES